MFRQQLTEWAEQDIIVTIRRGRRGNLRGFVDQVAFDFALLRLVNDDSQVDGHAIVQLDDITHLRWDGQAHREIRQAMSEADALRPESGWVNLHGWDAIVESVAQHERVISFFQEGIESDDFDLGTNVTVRGSWVFAEYVTARGTRDGWFATKLDHLTRIDFGGDYEKSRERLLKVER